MCDALPKCVARLPIINRYVFTHAAYFFLDNLLCITYNL